MKESSLLRLEGVKDLRIRPILLSTTKVTETFPALKKANRVILKEHPVYEEVNSDSVAVTILPYRHLECDPLLNVEVGNELLQEGGADRLGSGAKFHRISAIRDSDIYRNLG
jgi:hypothetical protein